MKKSLALLAAVALISQTFAIPIMVSKKVDHSSITQIVHVSPRGSVGQRVCPMCIEFIHQTIAILLNLIWNGGVVDTCGTLCDALAKKTGNQDLVNFCEILCDTDGVDEFVKLIQRAGLDHIYFCELLKRCAINDHGDATITVFDVVPKSGPQGVFLIDFSFSSKNGTGTGEIIVEVHTLDGIPVGAEFIHQSTGPGDFSTYFAILAKPDPNCDPTKRLCEQWIPGDYTVQIAICNGEYGSKTPHTEVYDQRTIPFTITG